MFKKDNCQKPLSKCWCEKNPHHPKCIPTLDIGLNFALITTAVVFIIYYTIKRKADSVKAGKC